MSFNEVFESPFFWAAIAVVVLTGPAIILLGVWRARKMK
jgi:hypothetical protein